MTRQLSPAPPRTMSEFDGYNGQFEGDGRAIHGVAPQSWIAGLEVPGPACHTPNGSFDPATFRPVAADVTCRRCLRSPDTRATAASMIDPDQLDLLEELEEFDDDPPREVTLKALPGYL